MKDLIDFLMSLPAWVVLAALLAVLIFPFALVAWAALMFRPRDRWLEVAPPAHHGPAGPPPVRLRGVPGGPAVVGGPGPAGAPPAPAPEDPPMTEPREGDAYVRKNDRQRFTIKAVTGPVGQYVTLAFAGRRGVLVVARHELGTEFERQESVAEAAERGFRPLLEGDPTFPTARCQKCGNPFGDHKADCPVKYRDVTNPDAGVQERHEALDRAYAAAPPGPPNPPKGARPEAS